MTSTNNRAAYMRYYRAMQHRARSSPEMLKLFDGGNNTRNQLFTMWVDAGEDLAKLQLNIKKWRKNTQNQKQKWAYQTRQQLLELYHGDSNFVSNIIAAKRSTGHFRPDPNFPSDEAHYQYWVVVETTQEHIAEVGDEMSTEAEGALTEAQSAALTTSDGGFGDLGHGTLGQVAGGSAVAPGVQVPTPKVKAKAKAKAKAQAKASALTGAEEILPDSADEVLTCWTTALLKDMGEATQLTAKLSSVTGTGCAASLIDELVQSSKHLAQAHGQFIALKAPCGNIDTNALKNLVQQSKDLLFTYRSRAKLAHGMLRSVAAPKTKKEKASDRSCGESAASSVAGSVAGS